MMDIKELNIAIIGNRDQTALMRLAGVDTYTLIEDDARDIRDKVREALKGYLDDATVGIVMIPENLVEHADDLLRQIRRSKKQSTIIVEFPSKFEMEKKNVREFYKSYTKGLIGFNVEI